MATTFKSRTALQVETLALRHQLAVLRRSVKRPKLTSADRLLWAWLCEVWRHWRSLLGYRQAANGDRWASQRFPLVLDLEVARGRLGRPTVPAETRQLIRRLSRDNPLWGAPRIHGELLKLGINISETSVSKYMVRHGRPSSQG